VAAPPTSKLAQDVARRIEQDVMDRGWPVGTVLGSETELIQRYGVSRAVFREAVRIVEHHTVARMRRGPGGGLVVMAPDASAIQRPAMLFVDYADIRAHELFEVRSSLELTCARVATENLDEAGIERLRAAAATEQAAAAETGPMHDFHIVLANLTGNPAMQLFVEILTGLTYERIGRASYSKAAGDDVHRAHAAIAEAVISGDAALAQHRMRTHLAAIAEYYERHAARSRRKRA